LFTNAAGSHDKRKAQIKKKAEALEKEAGHEAGINDRRDFGTLFLQLAFVVASVLILTRLQFLWLTSLDVGALGAGISLSAYCI
jgi:hypothetical protein